MGWGDVPGLAGWTTMNLKSREPSPGVVSRRWDYGRSGQRDTALKMETGVTGKGMQEASRSCKRPGNNSSLEPPGGISCAHTLTSSQ